MNEESLNKRIQVDMIFTYEIKNFELIDEIELHSMGTANVTDISMDGARICTLGQKLPEGCLLDISMQSLKRDIEIQAVGRVIWSKSVDTDTYDCRIQFLEFKDDCESKLNYHLNELKTALVF